MPAVVDKKGKITIRPEQILVIGVEPGDPERPRRNAADLFWLSGEKVVTIPWHLLDQAFVYAVDGPSLEKLMTDACRQGYMILEGNRSDRRGVTSFSVGIGAWGYRGQVKVKLLSSWAFEANIDRPMGEEVARLQTALRAACARLNEEKTPFRATGVAYVAALYRRLHLEPTEEMAEPLPRAVDRLCRYAHVGGPIQHVRTSLEPWVSIDRVRAFGTAMMAPLPCGKPIPVPVRKNGLERWKANDLMSRVGFADATVRVDNNRHLVPLLPLMKPSEVLQKNEVLYPCGRFRGTWALSELAWLEESGLGRVEALHEVYVFEARPVLRPIVAKIRSLEPDLSALGLKAKRLEHVLYGWCSGRATMHRFASAHGGEGMTVSDLVAPHVLRRLGPDVVLSKMRSSKGGHPLYQVRGTLTGKAPPGTMDRPDRSAWITASNRIEIGRVLRKLDPILSSREPGDYVGRVYVDGIDLQARLDQIPEIEGCTVKDHGTRMHIYRSGAVWGWREDGTTTWTLTGERALPKNATENDLRALLEHDPERSRGPFAGGRYWPKPETGDDSRMGAGVLSRPLVLDEEMIQALGFTMPP